MEGRGLEGIGLEGKGSAGMESRGVDRNEPDRIGPDRMGRKGSEWSGKERIGGDWKGRDWKGKEVNDMNKKIYLMLGLVGLTLFTLFALSQRAKAVSITVNNPSIDWCHCEPNGNCQTLSLPASALENAGHRDASGNPLHAGDYAGACQIVTPTPTCTPTPTVTPTVTVSPTPTVEPTITVTQTSDNPAPKGPPEWSDPCFYLRDSEECKKGVVLPAMAPATGWGTM